jgi:hypothetical protein
MPDLIPAKDGIVDRHPEAELLKKLWIPFVVSLTNHALSPE